MTPINFIKATLIPGLFILLGMQQQQDPFLGIWENEDKTLQIEMFYAEGTYHADLISINGESRKGNNPAILIQMMRDGKILYGGTYRDHITRKENEARIKLINDTTFTMKIFYGWAGKHYKWTRIKDKG